MKVNNSLNPGTMSFNLAFLLVATSPLYIPVVEQTHAIASVQIVAGEEIRFEEIRNQARIGEQRTTARQVRIRAGMPMTEFY